VFLFINNKSKIDESEIQKVQIVNSVSSTPQTINVILDSVPQTINVNANVICPKGKK